MKKVRSKKCVICSKVFTPRNSLQKCCSMNCALTYARQDSAQKKAKAEKAEMKARKEKLKSTGSLLTEAQNAVNKYIRLRDEGKPCISCGTPLISQGVGGGFDAGHYRSRGSSPHLRFYTLQIMGQCKRCNRYLGGNYHQFRFGLIERLGAEKVAQIDEDERPRHYSKEDLQRIKRIFNKKCRLLVKRKGM